jgi:hypothetical protein
MCVVMHTITTGYLKYSMRDRIGTDLSILLQKFNFSLFINYLNYPVLQ